MNAHELRGIEPPFDVCKSLLFEQPFSFGPKTHVVILRFNIIDL
jgi:hypothetical protein